MEKKETLYLLQAVKEIEALKLALDENASLSAGARLGLLQFIQEKKELFPFESPHLDVLFNTLKEIYIRRSLVQTEKHQDIIFFRLVTLLLVAFIGYLIFPYFEQKEEVSFDKTLYPYLFLAFLLKAEFLEVFLEKVMLLSEVKKEKDLLKNSLLLFHTLSLASLETIEKGISEKTLFLLKPSFLEGLLSLKRIFSMKEVLSQEEIKEREEKKESPENFKEKEKALFIAVEELLPLFQEEDTKDFETLCHSLQNSLNPLLSKHGIKLEDIFYDLKNLLSYSQIIKESVSQKKEQETHFITPI